MLHIVRVLDRVISLLRLDRASVETIRLEFDVFTPTLVDIVQTLLMKVILGKSRSLCALPLQ